MFCRVLIFGVVVAFSFFGICSAEENFDGVHDIKITVAFPYERQRLPFVKKTYMIGATDASRGEILYVNGVTTAVHRTGPFISMVDVKPGTNSIVVFQGRSRIVRNFVVLPEKKSQSEPFKLVESSDDPRLGERLSWRTTGRMFQNRMMFSPDGSDTMFFLPENFPISGCEVEGLDGWMVVWAEGRIGYIRKTLLKRDRKTPLPSVDAIVPNPAEGYPSSPPYGKSPSDVLICVDAGHGGRDSGAISPHGWTEKEVNLFQAQAIRDELEKAGFNVIMTRKGDSFPSLTDRVALACNQKVDAFISVHHNATAAHRDPREVRHTTTYASLSNGLHLAKCIQRYVGPVLAPIKDNGAQLKSLAVCRNPAIPSCLMEVDFINLPDGEAESWDFSRHRKVARAVVCGVLDWMKEKPAEKPRGKLTAE